MGTFFWPYSMFFILFRRATGAHVLHNDTIHSPRLYGTIPTTNQQRLSLTRISAGIYHCRISG